MVPDYVDLGLPSGRKWATMNVGATTVADDAASCYGDYFAWGETTTKAEYSLGTYVYYHDDTKYTLEAADDAARANWGSPWRMPTQADWQELIDNDNCTWAWQTDYNGVTGLNGWLVTSKSNANYIFLPAAGAWNETGPSNAGSIGYYWSSSRAEDANKAQSLLFTSSNPKMYSLFRHLGFPVRPVQ